MTEISGRTGLPVTVRRSAGTISANLTWSKLSARCAARLARKRLARPITAFCSCSRVGTLLRCAAVSGGIDG
jgi:hypothetical protein